METIQFAEIEAEFLRRVHKIVWCSMATVSTANRPRSRVLHPLWEGSTGWIATYPGSHKAKHLAENPCVSPCYVDVEEPLYADCKAEWVTEPAEKQRVWDLFNTTPPPVGYNMEMFFGSVDSPNYGLLKLTPWRVDLAKLMGESQIWRG